jgi:hypothetical protein
VPHVFVVVQLLSKPSADKRIERRCAIMLYSKA